MCVITESSGNYQNITCMLYLRFMYKLSVMQEHSLGVGVQPFIILSHLYSAILGFCVILYFLDSCSGSDKLSCLCYEVTKQCSLVFLVLIFCVQCYQKSGTDCFNYQLQYSYHLYNVLRVITFCQCVSILYSLICSQACTLCVRELSV